MTRINLVDPSMLTDKHLLAEYKEITRPFNKVIKRRINNTMGQVKIPIKYCLGAGHETFFFDKLEFLWYRYGRLYMELRKRNFQMNDDLFRIVKNNMYDALSATPYWNDYQPTPEDIYLNMARLCKRSKIDSVLDELDNTVTIS